MLFGGTTTVTLIVSNIALPFGLDANIFGIIASAIVYFSVTFLSQKVTT
jgi:SSS family solute:Na+ symporter